MIPESALYVGKLRHRRFEPKRHEFTYSLFMAFLDIDRIPEIMGRSRWTSYNRWNWASFEERDHPFAGEPVSLRQRVEAEAQRQGLECPDGPIFLLTHLRYLGYCFNPISLFYCYDRAGQLRSVLAEVRSTFGETTPYWLGDWNTLDAARDGNAFRYRCGKTMHVSPFMAMEHDYEFTLTAPADRLVAHMNTPVAGTARNFFDATLTLERREWTSANLFAVLARHPWMTAKVIGAIHWQALRLWLKGVPVFTHPDRIQPARKEASRTS